MYVLLNEKTRKFAHKDSIGEHDGLVTDREEDAAQFEDWGDASDYSQNFGPDWIVF
ncbi:hypothetical protein [Rhizobium sp. J15]|uniref:hypothetical protein n=1 Tax=Rhizobium sp. J15 TaxID=2035450 RepID=UPI001596892A|nr:hypothetical protein [Rhizobium sp. J15]